MRKHFRLYEYDESRDWQLTHRDRGTLSLPYQHNKNEWQIDYPKLSFSHYSVSEDDNKVASLEIEDHVRGLH